MKTLQSQLAQLIEAKVALERDKKQLLLKTEGGLCEICSNNSNGAVASQNNGNHPFSIKRSSRWADIIDVWFLTVMSSPSYGMSLLRAVSQ